MAKTEKVTACIVCAIEGNPKTGKTHLSLTFPDPIKVFSFDAGCKIVAAKFPDKAIDIEEYSLPIIDSLGTKDAGFEDLWKKVKADIEKAVASGEYKTIVIDTGTHLWEIIRYAWNEENDKAVGAGGKARTYGEPNARMYGIVMRAQVAGVNLVITHHLKDRWVKDENTGEKELDGWRRTEGLADVVLLTERVQRTIKDKEQAVIQTTLKECRFGLALCGYQQDMMTYEDLAAILEI